MRRAVLALLVLLVPETQATERVSRLLIDNRMMDVFGGQMRVTSYRNATADIFGQHSTDQLLNENTFTVFTVSEVEAALRNSTNQVSEDLSRRLDQKLLDADTKLRADVLVAVDGIPQRVLSDPVALAMQDRILERLREEMDQLRKDLQSQIDALREEP